jgi:hypothetical protein
MTTLEYRSLKSDADETVKPSRAPEVLVMVVVVAVVFGLVFIALMGM